MNEDETAAAWHQMHNATGDDYVPTDDEIAAAWQQMQEAAAQYVPMEMPEDFWDVLVQWSRESLPTPPAT